MDNVLQVKRLTSDAIMPFRKTILSAGFVISANESIVIPRRSRVVVKTGLSITCPPGTYGRIAPLREMVVSNSIYVGAGVIDADYRGEIGVILFNFDDVPFTVMKGEGIAQMILEKIYVGDIMEVNQLATTKRGSDGYGSTGI
jgi:deoxyuridine 5'-triphosphate nucleotidohydrolase